MSDDEDIIVAHAATTKPKSRKRSNKDAELNSFDQAYIKKVKEENTFSLLALMQNGAYLFKILECILSLVMEANFDCSEAGINMQSMDASHVSLVHMWLPASIWQVYECATNVSLGINIANLCKLLKGVKDGTSISMACSSQSDNYEVIKHDKNSKRSYTMTLMDIDAEHLGIPETEYDMIVKMPSSSFKGLCDEMSVLSDAVCLTGEADCLSFSAAGDLGKGTIACYPNASLNTKEHVSIELNECDHYKANFALRYLIEFSKMATLIDQVVLKLKDGCPMVVEYNLVHLGFVRFYLAPKLEEAEL